MSAWTRRSSTARPTNRLFRLVLESHDGKAPVPISEEKHEPASDIDIALMDSLKVLDPEGPIREADIACYSTRPSMIKKIFRSGVLLRGQTLTRPSQQEA